jgi:formylglycine-generating enzyme required for sulfatase activity
MVYAQQAPTNYGLLIGINDYDNDGIQTLKFPEADAKALAEYMSKSGYQVETLLGKQATRENIIKKFEALNQQGSGKGVVLVGMFGHGVEIPVKNEKGVPLFDSQGHPITEGCFMPFGTVIQQLKDDQGKPVFDDNRKPLVEPVPKSLVKLTELLNALNIAKAGNRIVLADCCRTVPNQALLRSFGTSFNSKDLPKNTSILFSCSPREAAIENPAWGHGAFTKCLLDELPKLAAAGDADTGVLSSRLNKQVPALVKTVLPNGDQNPVAFSTNTVDFQLRPRNTVPAGTKAGEQREIAGIKFRWCPPSGEQGFTMGISGDDPVLDVPVKVVLTKGFWLGETEVTQGQWKAVLGTEPWKEDGKLLEYVIEGPDYPVGNVSHGLGKDGVIEKDSATEFVKRLSKKEGKTFRLPTEAEWEYACRAGTTTAYSFGDDVSKLSDYAWWGTLDSGNTENEKYAHQVGLKRANPWGLYDMHGNVWEICSDCYNRKLPGGRDPVALMKSDLCVVRGGGWNSTSFYCHSSKRRNSLMTTRSFHDGFRIVLVPDEPTKASSSNATKIDNPVPIEKRPPVQPGSIGVKSRVRITTNTSGSVFPDFGGELQPITADTTAVVLEINTTKQRVKLRMAGNMDDLWVNQDHVELLND